MKRRLYETPDGYFDIPQLWVFDGSQLTDGSNALNQSIPILAGYGDFVLRRVVGLDRLLSNLAHVSGQATPPGQFQIQDALGNYLEQVPTYVTTGGQANPNIATATIAVLPERMYKENTKINFDLYDILRAADPSGNTFSAQLGFHGVRRQKGQSPLEASYRYRPKTFAYITQAFIRPSAVVSAGLNATPIVSVFTPVINYDFELYELRVSYAQPAFAFLNTTVELDIISTLSGSQGNGVTLAISAAVAPNQSFSITVAGSTVTVVLQTNSGGNITTGLQALVNALNNTAAVTALFIANTSTPGALAPAGVTLIAAGGSTPQSLDVANALLQLYDQNKIQAWSQPVNDLFVNALSYYKNGAFVPPLFYRKDSTIRMDVSTLQKGVMFQITVEYHGRQRIPC